MEHTTHHFTPSPPCMLFSPGASLHKKDTPSTSPHPRIHGCQPLSPHNNHRRRDTLPGKQCVLPVFSYQRITGATGNTALPVRKTSSRRKIPYHFNPLHLIDSL